MSAISATDSSNLTPETSGQTNLTGTKADVESIARSGCKTQPAEQTELQQQCGFAVEKEGQTKLGELIYRDGALLFETNFAGVINEYKTESSIVIPPPGLIEFTKRNCLQLPSARCNTDTKPLAEKIADFARRYADWPEHWYEPIAHYIQMTWLYDQFSAVPYLRFLGESGTGKTRALEIAAALSYRSLFVSGNITGAALFRSIDLIQGTLVVDEGDLRNSDAWSDIVKVFNNGYSKGTPVMRCNKDKGFDVEAFSVFGPKVIATRSRFEDDALENRCWTFETSKRKLRSEIPLQLPGEFYRDALQLRNELLGWRFKNYGKIERDDSTLRYLNNPRLAQIGSCVTAIAETEQACARLISFIEKYNVEAKESSWVALTETVVAECFAAQTEFLVKKVAWEVNSRLGFEMDDYGNHVGEEDGPKPVTSNRISSILRSLGYTTHHTRLGSLARQSERA